MEVPTNIKVKLSAERRKSTGKVKLELAKTTEPLCSLDLRAQASRLVESEDCSPTNLESLSSRRSHNHTKNSRKRDLRVLTKRTSSNGSPQRSFGSGGRHTPTDLILNQKDLEQKKADKPNINAPESKFSSRMATLEEATYLRNPHYSQNSGDTEMQRVMPLKAQSLFLKAKKHAHLLWQKKQQFLNQNKISPRWEAQTVAMSVVENMTPQTQDIPRAKDQKTRTRQYNFKPKRNDHPPK